MRYRPIESHGVIGNQHKEMSLVSGGTSTQP